MNAPVAAKAETFDCRPAFAETLVELAGADPRIVAVCNDSVGSSNLTQFQKTFPDRLINVGIAEQDMIGVAAGLANGGFLPFVCGAAPFLTGRGLEQIKVDVAYNGFPVVLCGMSPGMAYGELGPTHHSIEDLSWLRAIDGLAIVVPADPAQTRAAVRWAAKAATPAYLRIGRTKVPVRHARRIERLRIRTRRRAAPRIGADHCRHGRAGQPRARRRRGARRTGPRRAGHQRLDHQAARRSDDHRRRARDGGDRHRRGSDDRKAGSAPRSPSTVVRNAPVPMRILGVKGFAPTGSATFLLDHFGLSRDGIVAAAMELKGR